MGPPGRDSHECRDHLPCWVPYLCDIPQCRRPRPCQAAGEKVGTSGITSGDGLAGGPKTPGGGDLSSFFAFPFRSTLYAGRDWDVRRWLTTVTRPKPSRLQHIPDTMPFAPRETMHEKPAVVSLCNAQGRRAIIVSRASCHPPGATSVPSQSLGYLFRVHRFTAR